MTKGTITKNAAAIAPMTVIGCRMAAFRVSRKGALAPALRSGRAPSGAIQGCDSYGCVLQVTLPVVVLYVQVPPDGQLGTTPSPYRSVSV